MTAAFHQPLQIRARLGGVAARVGQGLRAAVTAVRNRLGGGRARVAGRGGTSNS